MGSKDFAKIIHEYCTTGSIINGHEYELTDYQEILVNELKKLIRKTTWNSPQQKEQDATSA